MPRPSFEGGVDMAHAPRFRLGQVAHNAAQARARVDVRVVVHALQYEFAVNHGGPCVYSAFSEMSAFQK